MYERPGSQGSDTSYTIIEWAFVLNTPTGEFGSYYGGMELTRQGGEPPPAATLTGLSIDGPSSMSEYDPAKYTATANWSDGSTSIVTATWSVNSQLAEISSDGFLYCLVELASDQRVTIRATYSDGSIAISDTMDVTITNVRTIPFTNEELLGKVFFQEYSDESSFLYILLVRTITQPGPGAMIPMVCFWIIVWCFLDRIRWNALPILPRKWR